MGETSPPRETLGMTEEELEEYLDELIRGQAEQVAAESGKSVEEELDSPGFAAARAASAYAVKLISANNVFLSRHLLDLGLLDGNAAPQSEQ